MVCLKLRSECKRVNWVTWIDSHAAPRLNTSSALATIVSPLVFGYVSDKTGDWTLPFLGSIQLLVIGTIAGFWTKPDEELPGAALTATLAAKEAELWNNSDMQTYLSASILLLSRPI